MMLSLGERGVALWGKRRWAEEVSLRNSIRIGNWDS
jgi:hypothetical protein